MRDIPFKLGGRLVTFEKSEAEEGQRRRIAGVISSEARDRQGEILLQDGLDFQPFLKNGWFNDNHSRATDGIVGAPTEVRRFDKGAVLPNGEVAASKCTWAEGYLLKDHPKADAIWQLSQSLAKSPDGRALGFSVEGSVQKRVGRDKRTVAKAVIQNCAVTNAPVNTDTRLEVLAKSIQHIDAGHSLDLTAAGYALNEASEAELSDLLKSLFVGAEVSPAQADGPGAAAPLTREALDDDLRILDVPPEGEPNKKKKKKKLSKAEALGLLCMSRPAERAATLERVVDHAIELGRQRAARESQR